MKAPVTILLLACLLGASPSFAESYTFSGGKNNMVHTIAAEVLTRAYKKAGIKINPVFLTLEDSLQRSNAGETDGELARLEKITQSFPNLLKVPVAIVSVEPVTFSKNTSLTINDWNDLRSHKLTVIKGAKCIEAKTKDIKKSFVFTLEEALELLQTDQTELVVAPKLSLINLIHQKKYHDIKAVSNSLQKIKLYHFVHKKNKHLIPTITPILQSMQQSGEIAFIRKTQLLKAASHFSPQQNITE